MSRFRMAILLALLAIVALPTSAHARRIAYCHLFSPEAVGRAVDYRGMRVEGQVTSAVSLLNTPGRMTICDYWSGRDTVAESTVTTFGTTKKTGAEFRALLRNRASDHPHRVGGPWREAAAFSNGEIFVLKGRHIFHIEYRVKTTKATNRMSLTIAKTAARKL